MICWQDKDFPHNYFYKEMREYIVIVQTVSQLRITEIQRGEISAFWVSEDRLYRGCLSSSACSVISVVSNSLRPPDCSPPGFLSMRILQARILEWVAMPSSRGSSRTRDGIHVSCVSCTGWWVLYHLEASFQKNYNPDDSHKFPKDFPAFHFSC